MPLDRTWVNALVNDDGSNTVGELWDKADVIHIYDDVDAALRWTEVSTTATGTVHNFNPGIVGNTVIRCGNAAPLTITGFPAGTQGQLIRVVSLTNQVTFAHANTGSAVGARLVNMASSANTPISVAGVVEYQYQAADGAWYLRTHEQGAWIMPPYSGANFGAGGSMTWTVDAGDVTALSYRLSGRTMHLACALDATTVGGTLGVEIHVRQGCWGGFQVGATQVNGNISVLTEAGAFVDAFWQSGGGGTVLRILKKGFGAFTAQTNNTSLYFTALFPVV